MKAEFWALIGAKKKYGGWCLAGAPKCSISKPEVPRDSFAVKIIMDIPDSVFEKPSLEVGIKIPEPNSNLKITPSMIDGIQQAIQSQVGLNVHVSCDEVDAE